MQLPPVTLIMLKLEKDFWVKLGHDLSSSSMPLYQFQYDLFCLFWVALQNKCDCLHSDCNVMVDKISLHDQTHHALLKRTCQSKNLAIDQKPKQFPYNKKCELVPVFYDGSKDMLRVLIVYLEERIAGLTTFYLSDTTYKKGVNSSFSHKCYAG